MDALQYPWATEPAVSETPRLPDESPPQPKPRGRRPASVTRAAAPEAVLTATSGGPDWLYHHLTVSGPAEPVAAFAAAARGAGVTPWRLDPSGLEEDVFARAVAQPAARRHLTVAGCRILARQFRARVEARQARAAARVGRSSACPFDLHTLLPVPAAMLQLGPSHPDALAWLSAQWGITDRLRQVVERPKPTTGRRLPRNHAVIGYGFFTDGETPHAAITRLAATWTALRFSLVPRPAG